MSPALPNKPSLQSRDYLEEEQKQEVPGANNPRSAGPGPNTKVKGFYYIEPSLTDTDYLHGKL